MPRPRLPVRLPSPTPLPARGSATAPPENLSQNCQENGPRPENLVAPKRPGIGSKKLSQNCPGGSVRPENGSISKGPGIGSKRSSGTPQTASKSLRRPSRRKSSACPAATPTWIPKGEDLKRIPPDVQAALAETIQPAYEQLVLQAAHPIDRSLGHTLVHLLWLEVLEQYDLGLEYLNFHAALGLPGGRSQAIDQHLRLINSKLRVGYFLQRVQEIRRRHAEAPPLPNPPAPSPAVDALEKTTPVDQKHRLPR